MVELIAENIQKTFNEHVLFSGFSGSFASGETIAITGSNGAGKSTLMQILSGFCVPGNGKVLLFEEGRNIPSENMSRYVTFASPYLQLPGELSAGEIYQFHKKAGKIKSDISEKQFLKEAVPSNKTDRPIRTFSSGMTQRLKLSLSFFSKADILFLDEPLSNLDMYSASWFKETLVSLSGNKLIFIASNHQEQEISTANRIFDLADFRG